MEIIFHKTLAKVFEISFLFLTLFQHFNGTKFQINFSNFHSKNIRQ